MITEEISESPGQPAWNGATRSGRPTTPAHPKSLVPSLRVEYFVPSRTTKPFPRRPKMSEARAQGLANAELQTVSQLPTPLVAAFQKLQASGSSKKSLVPPAAISRRPGNSKSAWDQSSGSASGRTSREKGQGNRSAENWQQKRRKLSLSPATDCPRANPSSSGYRVWRRNSVLSTPREDAKPTSAQPGNSKCTNQHNR